MSRTKKSSNNEFKVETVVLKCFIRTLKDKHMFPLYLKGVGTNGIIHHLLKKRYKKRDTPFANLRSNKDVIITLHKISTDMAQRGQGRIDDPYEYVTMTVNHLLHFFVESVVKCDLMALGEEIYCRSCNQLFGDSIEEFEAQKEAAERQRLEQLRINAENLRKQMEEVARPLGHQRGERDQDGVWAWDGQGIALGGRPDNHGDAPQRPAWLDDNDDYHYGSDEDDDDGWIDLDDEYDD